MVTPPVSCILIDSCKSLEKQSRGPIFPTLNPKHLDRIFIADNYPPKCHNGNGSEDTSPSALHGTFFITVRECKNRPVSATQRISRITA
jgi:hypothetical protein